MPALPSSQIAMSQINTEFGLGNALSNYRNARWFRDNNSRGYFGTLDLAFSQFWGKRKNTPVVAGSYRINDSQNISIPMFNNLTVTAYSGQGGQGGINGNCAGGGWGGNGGGSYLADYVGTGEGPGGSPSGNWGSRASASVSLSIDDSNQDSIIARYGVVKYAGIGAGGGGGSTGANLRGVTVCTFYCWCGFPCCCATRVDYYCDQYTGGGAGGGKGFIDVSWN